MFRHGSQRQLVAFFERCFVISMLSSPACLNGRHECDCPRSTRHDFVAVHCTMGTLKSTRIRILLPGAFNWDKTSNTLRLRCTTAPGEAAWEGSNFYLHSWSMEDKACESTLESIKSSACGESKSSSCVHGSRQPVGWVGSAVDIRCQPKIPRMSMTSTRLGGYDSLSITKNL
jgi:hypothetical protein